MTEKIGGFGRLGPGSKLSQTGTTDQTSKNKALPKAQDSSQGGDAVSLTETATRLQSIEARLRELPDVDQARVDELRQLIDSGEYEMDLEQIARRLVELEAKL